MKAAVAAIAIFLALAGCTEPQTVDRQPKAECPLLPEPPKTPTHAYMLLVIDMYRICASR